jgi:hypothetical protein
LNQHKINIREYVSATLTPQGITQLQEAAKASGPNPTRIVTVVEAIHSGLTRNYTFYPAQNLEKSTDSWTTPYLKPVIKNHNTDEEPNGRVLSATFKQSNIAPDKQTIQLELEIIDPDAIQKVLDGRYQTLSIGGNTSSAVCSICGKDLVKEGYCGHMKGRVYESKQAYWIIGEMEFDEISWVNVPADRNAQVIQKDISPQQKESASTEGGQQMSTQQANQAAVDDHSLELLDQIDKLLVNQAATQPDPATPAEETPAEPAATEPPATTTEDAATDPAEETPAETDPPAAVEPTTEEKLITANARITALEAQAVIDGQTIVTLTADKVASDILVIAAQEAATTAKADADVIDAENKALLKQNVTLATYTHKVLAESAASLMVVLGKATEGQTYETLLEDLAKQPSRQLKEQIATLAAEKPARIIAHIESPGANLTEGDTGTTPEEKKEVTLEDLGEVFQKAFTKKLTH